MYTFPELIRLIRKESELTQSEFAHTLGVSPILISMVETGQKTVSKGLVRKLADKLEVSPGTLFPFIFIEDKESKYELSGIEKKLMDVGTKMQLQLIKVKSKKLKPHESP